MILSYPILAFLAGKTGHYRSLNADISLEIRKNGYGFIFLSDSSKTQGNHFYGMTGTRGIYLDLYINMGHSNVLIFSLEHDFKEINKEEPVVLDFIEKEGSAAVQFIFFEDKLSFSFTFGNEIAFELQKIND